LHIARLGGTTTGDAIHYSAVQTASLYLSLTCANRRADSSPKAVSVQDIKHAIVELSPRELAELSARLVDYQAKV
jgi:hypothetical protein